MPLMLQNKTIGKDPKLPAILVNTRVAAQSLSISERKLWQLKNDKVIPSVKFGKSVRFRPADLEEWARLQTMETNKSEKEEQDVEHQ
jgi:excisionase family DNA binding protein